MRTVLIVDDSESIRAFLKFALEQDNFTVYEASNGQEALIFLDNPSIKLDIIITDLHMPVMDGLEFIRQSRQRPGFKYLPILMLTTESAIEQKIQAKQAGATGWIVKPITPDKLLQVINKCVR